jgi:hypothetical protein
VNRQWSAQGLGMLRLYLPGNRRLHVWTRAVKVPRATTLHTHPWDFESLVLRGVIHNFKFTRMPGSPTHCEYRVRCGVGAGLVGNPVHVRLVQTHAQSICEGAAYAQTFDEIHESCAEEGTVTLITRQVRACADHAQTFVPFGESWVSVEPRAATPAEAAIAEHHLAIALKGRDLSTFWCMP